MHAFQLLKSDHDRVNQLLDQIDMSDDFDEKMSILQELKQEFSVHAHLEETIFYPKFRSNSDLEELITDSYDDHQEVRDLITEIAQIDTIDEFDDRFEELIECIEDHVDNEENELFPKVEELVSEDELLQMGEQMEITKKQLQETQAA